PGMSFTDNGDGTATLAGTPTAGGAFTFTITASNGVAPNPTQAFTATVNQSPTITSADHTTFAVGTAGSFTVTTNPGTPAATTLTRTGALPAGVTFTDNGDGTATLAGTPAAGTGGSYSLTITASNTVPPDATQSFTLTVTQLPAFSSASSTTFTVGSAGSFPVTSTAGYPAPRTLSETGALPSGVTFVDNGDGTATLAGTPAAGTGGSYPLTLTVTNTAGHVDQSFTLTVGESAAITSANSTTFVAGTAGSFTVTTAGGFPTPPHLTQTGTLPGGVTFVDNGNGTATLSGTATAGGVYPLTFTASNGGGADVSQAFTLTINGPPSITSANSMVFNPSVVGHFTVTTRAGVPATPITITRTGALPPGVSFTDNGNGTATLSGRPHGDAIGKTYHLVFTASNGVQPDATQNFTLLVTRPHEVPLPSNRPEPTAYLHGVAVVSLAGSLAHISGSGCAAGAPVTIGEYPGPVTLTKVIADGSGHFTATIRLPVSPGHYTFVASCLGNDGKQHFLEVGALVIAHEQPSGGGSQAGNGGGGLANTGPDTDPRTTAGYALAAILAGLMLLGATRRRRRITF
ncbi:MAG: putative Ig domain-containing protein, partial [Jatrophihabitantaceae bacterium]